MSTPTAKQLLEFEAANLQHSTRKETAIRDQLGIAPARYYQLLRRLIQTEQALELDPILTHTLRRRSLERRRGRAPQHSN